MPGADGIRARPIPGSLRFFFLGGVLGVLGAAGGAELSQRDFPASASVFSSLPHPTRPRANPAGRGTQRGRETSTSNILFSCSQEKIQARLDFLRKERQELLEFKVNDDKKTQELLVGPRMGWWGSLERGEDLLPVPEYKKGKGLVFSFLLAPPPSARASADLGDGAGSSESRVGSRALLHPSFSSACHPCGGRRGKNPENNSSPRQSPIDKWF